MHASHTQSTNLCKSTRATNTIRGYDMTTSDFEDNAKMLGVDPYECIYNVAATINLRRNP